MTLTLRLEVPTIEINLNLNSAHVSQVLAAISSLETKIMTKLDEMTVQLQAAKDTIDATAAQNAKANAEISAGIAANLAAVADLHTQITALQAQVDGNTDLPPDFVALVNGITTSANAAKATSQALDDLTPDAPVAG